MREVERKFLVSSDAYKEEASSAIHIQQGFLNSDPERTVRVRSSNDGGKITVKGIPDEAGISRFEWERDITTEEARHLLKLCEGSLIVKTRYVVPFGEHVFEVDVFEGENTGLVIAEIELETANETFQRPSWLGAEVTGDPKYYNAQLSRISYKQW